MAKQKNKSGHPRNFKTPEDLWKAFEDYIEYTKEKSKEWLKISYVGKDGEKKEDAQKMPLTMDGFEVYCYPIHGVIEQYFKNKDGLYTEYVPICSHIKKYIRDNQITGGMLGFYNPSITQRLNGLTDKQDVDVKSAGEALQPVVITMKID